jgi:UDP-GlcNAc3NAcA epimerase
MKVMVVFGTRPQIIKTSVLIEALQSIGLDSVLVYTGQHYDIRLSDIFFQELNLRKPDYNLGIGSGSYEYQINAGVKALKKVIEREKPDQILTIGDSNPALVGSLGGYEMGIKLAHSEAGLRSGSSIEPEEQNRKQIDSIADYLFCSTEECVNNLLEEEVTGIPVWTGDLLNDAWKRYEHLVDQAKPKDFPHRKFNDFCVFSLHRRGNAYNPERLKLFVNMLRDSWSLPTVWPMHPGIQNELRKLGLLDQLQTNKNLFLIPPLSYLEMRWLEKNCSVVVTDSVGLQVEAYLAQKPSIVLRNEMEYHSLEAMGWSVRVDPSIAQLDQCSMLARDLISNKPSYYDKELFGNGEAAYYMATMLKSGYVQYGLFELAKRH